jgi:hypothetical protein
MLRLSSRTLGKIDAEIAVLSWNKFYCQGPRALFPNQEISFLRMRQTELSLSGQDNFSNRSAFLLSWNNFYCQGTTTLFHIQETASLRMRQTEFSLSGQDRC